jgi:hypothetical protein
LCAGHKGRTLKKNRNKKEECMSNGKDRRIALIALLTEKLEKVTRFVTPAVAQAIGSPKEMDRLVSDRNRRKELFCVECCTRFSLDGDGQWRSGHKEAEVVAGRLIVCTCGTTIGVIVSDVTVPGEVVGVR